MEVFSFLEIFCSFPGSPAEWETRIVQRNVKCETDDHHLVRGLAVEKDQGFNSICCVANAYLITFQLLPGAARRWLVAICLQLPVCTREDRTN